MEAVVAEEGAMDNVLHKKIVDAVKNYMSDAVTLVEGFVSVQINGSDFRHIHISYRDLSLEPDESNSASEAVTPPPAAPVAPKVSRRKAYMPIKCRARTDEPEPEVPMQELDLPLQGDSFGEEAAAEVEEATHRGPEGSGRNPAPLSRSSHLQHLLLPEVRPSNADPLALPRPGPGMAAVDCDPIGPLNAESIQASMHRVMQPSYPGLPPADHISSIALNAVIPIPAVLPASSQRPKLPAEQRKIKPKPALMTAGCLSNTSPYTKPPPGLSKRNPNKEFACNQCHLKFKSLHNLTEHTTAVHICFRCTTCNAKFTQRSNLQRHSLKHLGFKPFRCAVCLKEYYRKDHLVRHVEVSHPGSEPKASIVNILPSAECLRILEETQSKNRAAQEAQAAATPGPPSGPSKAEVLNQSDLLNLTFPTDAHGLAIPVENESTEDYGGIVNLEEDGRESEEDGEDMDDEDDFGLEDDALIFAPHLSLPLSHHAPATADCSIVNNLTS